MSNKELDQIMDEAMKEAKAHAKEVSRLTTGLKKKDRETEDYKNRVHKAAALQKEWSKPIDKYWAAYNKKYK